MIAFRPATAADIPVLVVLERMLFGVDAWGETGCQVEVDSSLRRVVVAEAADEVVGYAVSTRGAAPGDPVDLLRIGVRPDHQRSGLGGLLLADVLQASAPARVLLEVAVSNAAALALYARQGFVEIDRRRGYYRAGEDAVVMERTPTTGGGAAQ